MKATTRIPQEQLFRYFDAFTKRYLRDDSPEAADIEYLEPELGDQVAAQGTRLLGITYDPRDNALEFLIEAADRSSADHRIFHPKEVWVVEEPDGFVSAVQVVRPDGARDLVSVRRVGLRPVE